MKGGMQRGTNVREAGERGAGSGRLTLFIQRKDGYQYTDRERRVKTFREFVLILRQ